MQERARYLCSMPLGAEWLRAHVAPVEDPACSQRFSQLHSFRFECNIIGIVDDSDLFGDAPL